ncbi:MAG: putative peptidoglycan lipid II flippase [Saprospiraceae bacterium]|jgi:putative peptidoglycan lipid II flippase
MSEKILKSTFVIGLMTLVSRISGLVRDNLFAQFLGSGLVADVFFVAFRLPNFFRRLFGEGAFSAAFVPVYSDMAVNRSELEARQFLALVTGRLICCLLVVCALGVWGAPWLVSVIAPGFSSDLEKFDLAVSYTRIMFPYLFFISLVALSAGMLNTKGRFAVAAFTPVILNLCLIAGIWFFVRGTTSETNAVAWSVIAAGILQLIFQLPFLAKERCLVRPRVQAKPDEVEANAASKKVYQLMLPALFGVSIAQINLLVNTLLASLLVSGSISWLYYSDRLMEFPVGVFGIALATAILPKLSKDHANSSPEAFSLTLDWACRLVVLIAVPAMAALIVLGEAMITTLYFYGKFNVADVDSVYRSLVAFSLGIVPIIMIKVLAPGFYAKKNTRTPVRIGVIAMGVNILFALLLFKPMMHVGLALSTSIAALVNASLLFILLKKENTFKVGKGWPILVGRVLASALLMTTLLWWTRGALPSWLDAGAWERIIRLCGLVMLGGGAYAVSLLVLGARPHQFSAPQPST